MNMPGFTAEGALGAAVNQYRTRSNQSVLLGRRQVVPQQNEFSTEYACSSAACACSGAYDCLNCALDHKCGGNCVCVGQTCVCDH
jgi:hypothetical protein